tara:strand:- start:4509 stop:6740 length:2232 start_codon:yes stop_codon:yes gene_type:complete
MSIFSSLLGIGEEQPRLAPTGTVVTEQSLAEEISPFYKDLLEKSQAFLTSELERGYQPYTGQTIADRDPRELQAIQGIESLVGTQAPYFDQAKGLLDTQADKFTAEAAKEYMNPYQQAVTDVAKREALDDFDLIRQKFEKQAVGAGGMSGLGTRAAVQTGLLGEALAQNLSDIQTKGSAAAFEDARRSFIEQKGRERGLAAALPQFGTTRFGAEARELSGLQAVGEDERARQQLSLDEAYKDFLEEERFEPKQLERYQSVIQGFPNISTQVRSTQGPVPSSGQRFLSSAAGLGALYGSFGGFTPQGFGSSSIYDPGRMRGAATGGQVRYAAGGGLAGLPVVKAQQGSQGRTLSQDITDNVVLQRLGRGAALTLGPVYDASSEILRYLTGYDAGSAQDLTGIAPYNISKDAKATLAQLKGTVPTAQASPQVQQFGGRGTIVEPEGERARYLETEEAIRTAEVLNPGLKRDPDSPTGFNLKDDRIQAGSGGMSAEGLYQMGAPDRLVLAETQKIDKEEQALQDLLKAQDAATTAKLTALRGAKESKTKRDQARREAEKNRDLVNILSRFSKNILSTDDGGATIGSAFAKSTLEQDPARQKELDRADTMAGKLEEIDAAIATAQADGDLQRAQMLMTQRNKMTELNLKRSTLAVKRKAAQLDTFFKMNKLKVDQTKALTEIAEKIAKAGVSGDSQIITDLINQVFEKYPVDPDIKKSIIKGTISITSPSAVGSVDPRSSREQTASE